VLEVRKAWNSQDLDGTSFLASCLCYFLAWLHLETTSKECLFDVDGGALKCSFSTLMDCECVKPYKNLVCVCVCALCVCVCVCVCVLCVWCVCVRVCV